MTTNGLSPLVNGMTIEDLLALHKSTFGDATMTAPNGSEGNTGEPQGGDPADTEDPEGSGGEDDRDPQAKIKALNEEKDRHFKKFQSEKERADDLAAKLKEIEEAGLEEGEKVKRQNEELTATVTTLTEANQLLRLENAFLTDNTYSWHNPKRALKLVDLSEVEIADDGTVKGLDNALKNLAKSDPYLIKAVEKDDGKPGPKTGDTVNPPKNQKQGEADREKLLQKYPGLRR